MWKAFWGNPGSNAAKDLPRHSRLALLTRATFPQLSFRCSRWPPQSQIASEVDQVQQKMVASLMRLPPLRGEEAPDYVRRRGRLARKVCADCGIWSHHWFTRSIRWDEHLSRPANAHSWASQLREYRGKQWLMDRRASFATAFRSNVSVHAGRTGTRAFRGIVHTRWHDGVDYGRTIVPVSRTSTPR